jgi:hypothetical protein
MAAGARCAQACDATAPQVHASGQLIWCADPDFWAAHSADVTPFFSYGDALLPRIQADFGVNSNQTFYIVVNAPNGAASTPTPYGPGVNVSGDSFYNVAYDIPGFYGYLLVTHEFVNQWTGLAIGSGGWPTDWWANHRSPFPNAIAPIILSELGKTAAAAAQLARFVPGGDSADIQVPMFTSMFNDFGGWDMFRLYFSLLRADNMQWPNLRDPPDYSKQTTFVSGNPSPLLANYVVAYFNIATRIDVQPRFDAGGVGTKPPNWAASDAWTNYSLDANVIKAIAKAHCRLTASDPNTQLVQAGYAALQHGDYQTVLDTVPAAQTCNAACTQGCACDSVTDSCMPSYLAQPAAAAPTASPVDNPNSTAASSGAAGAPQQGPVMYEGCACNSAGGGLELLGGCVSMLAWRWRRRGKSAAKR